MTIVNYESKLCDLLSFDPAIITVLNRFDIQLGVSVVDHGFDAEKAEGIAHQHAVNQAAQQAAAQSRQDHHQHIAAGGVVAENGHAGAEHQGGAQGKIDLPCDDDHCHTDGHGSHDDGILAGQNAGDMPGIEHVSVGKNGDGIHGQNDDKYKDVAVAAPGGSQTLGKGFAGSLILVHSWLTPFPLLPRRWWRTASHRVR